MSPSTATLRGAGLDTQMTSNLWDIQTLAASTLSSPVPSFVEKSPTTTITAPQPKASIFRRLFGFFLKPLPTTTTAPFAPTSAAPHSLFPHRTNITTTVTDVRLTSVRCTAIKCTAMDKKVCVKASVRVTVHACCCCGPDGREVSSTATFYGNVYPGTVKYSLQHENSLVNGTAQATESAALRSYEEAVSYATAKAVTAVEKKFARTAAKALYRK